MNRSVSYEIIQEKLKSEQFDCIKKQIKFDYNLSKISWMKVGGKAAALFKPKNTNELLFFLKNFPYKQNIHINGLGANTVFASEKLNFVVIKLIGEFNFISTEGSNKIKCGTGTISSSLSRFAQEKGLSGFEFLFTIPGTIGGNLKTNAGCYGSELKDVLSSLTYCNLDGEIFDIKNHADLFSYRSINLPDNLIFLSAEMQGQKDCSLNIQKRMDEMEVKRKTAQPSEKLTSGSTFKNNKDIKAWEVIDKLGLRNYNVNGASFSEKHCNFIINDGTASFYDIIELKEKAKQLAKERMNTVLEEEVFFIGSK